jgi:predicted nucleic acid-binding Zn ribbon protein
MRRRNTELLSTVIDQVLRTNKLDRKLAEKHILDAWPKVLGESVMHYTTKLEIKRGVLYVSLSSAVLRHELFLSGNEIKESLNKYAGTKVISDIIFC